MQHKARTPHTLWLISMSGWLAWAWFWLDRGSCLLPPSSPPTPLCWDDICVLEMWTSITSFLRYICSEAFTRLAFSSVLIGYLLNETIDLSLFSVQFSSMWIRKRVIDRSTTATASSGQLPTAPTSSPLCLRSLPSRQSTCWRGNQVCGGEFMWSIQGWKSAGKCTQIIRRIQCYGNNKGHYYEESFQCTIDSMLAFTF